MFGWLRQKKRDGVGTGRVVALRERDCHSHVIPGVDDGSRTMDESIAMLRILERAGVKRLIATPHIRPGRFPNEPDPLRAAFTTVVEEAARERIELELELGAEHYLDETFLDRIRRGALLSFGPEKYVLFETHVGADAPVDLPRVVHELVDRGFTPLVAHVERYPYLRGEEGLELAADLRAAGAKFQVNRTTGDANRPGVGSRGRIIAELLDRDWIDEVGSDLHRATSSGRPEAA